MTELTSVEVGTLSPEAVAELMAGVDVVSRRLGERRPARWARAPVDVLSSLPTGPYTLVASLWAPASSTWATAVAYEQCPQAAEAGGRLGTHSRDVQLLISRARELGADAIVLHGVALGVADDAASFGIH